MSEKVEFQEKQCDKKKRKKTDGKRRKYINKKRDRKVERMRCVDTTKIVDLEREVFAGYYI